MSRISSQINAEIKVIFGNVISVPYLMAATALTTGLYLSTVINASAASPIRPPSSVARDPGMAGPIRHRHHHHTRRHHLAVEDRLSWCHDRVVRSHAGWGPGPSWNHDNCYYRRYLYRKEDGDSHRHDRRYRGHN